MAKPKLYLFIGFPGAGKTTTAKLIAERSNAVHLWADQERHRMFEHPTHSEQESVALYEQLNQTAGDLLAEGKDVVFDTNFNFYSDREKLREIAKQNGAETVIIWITTPAEVARQRAVSTSATRNGYDRLMTEEEFNNIAGKLEPPRQNEKVIKIDGTKLDLDEAIALLGL
jgi:predicted kinase